MAEDSPERHTRILGLLVVLLLVGVALLVIRNLRDSAAMQDCVMQGRSNCAPPISTGQ
jgi:uncharacterized membrane protein